MLAVAAIGVLLAALTRLPAPASALVAACFGALYLSRGLNRFEGYPFLGKPPTPKG